MLGSYASLYFVACINQGENELLALETIHHFVEVLDRYFGNVSGLEPHCPPPAITLALVPPCRCVNWTSSSIFTRYGRRLPGCAMLFFCLISTAYPSGLPYLK